MLLFTVLSCICFLVNGENVVNLNIVILDQPSSHNHQRSLLAVNHINAQQLADKCVVNTVTLTHDFSHVNGAWAILPLLSTFHHKLTSPYWVLFMEEDTRVDVSGLCSTIASLSMEAPFFGGHGLFDEETTIIHHYAFAGGRDVENFLYPDFAAGVLMNSVAVATAVARLSAARMDFTIDPKHELAMLMRNEDVEPIVLTHLDEFCLSERRDRCLTWYMESTPELCSGSLPMDSIYFGVKTFSGYHKTRLVVLKRTWGKDVRNIEFFSDIDDLYVPTIVFPDLNNTEHGHCGKTLEIIRHFGNLSKKYDFLVIVDDDTLVSVPRLYRYLSCFDPMEALILGERYAYGFNPSGEYGYSFPTGGAGMVFTRKAAEIVAKKCRCPSPDSPDDMIIGMCAQSQTIPIIHSAAFHQARVDDYSKKYLNRIKPVTFHKHWNNDPYEDYVNYLTEQWPKTDGHSEL